MDKIKLLPEYLINQIAAGEIIENPYSIVKELIENSVDANSTKINIEFRKGGKSYIKVTDNGIGMSSKDALMSLQRHATSKIYKINDLNNIKSFGFRGEAIPSIAAFTQLTLKTCINNNKYEGIEINLNKGNIVNKKLCVMKSGTIIIASNIFYGFPVRMKFLKSNNIEASKIINHVKLFSLSHINISFKLCNENRLFFNLLPCNNLIDRIEQLWGHTFIKNLKYLNINHSELNIYGFISMPGIYHYDTSKMIIFINERIVNNQLIKKTIIEIYKDKIPKGYYPIMFLFIKIPYNQIDINVHPFKQDIKFKNESFIKKYLIKYIPIAIFQHNNINKKNIKKTNIDNVNKEDALINYFNKNLTGCNNYNDIKFLGNLNNNKYFLYKQHNDIIIMHQKRAYLRIKYEQLLLKIKKSNALNSFNVNFSFQINYYPYIILQNNINILKIKFHEIGLSLKMNHNKILNVNIKTIPLILKKINQDQLKLFLEELLLNYKIIDNDYLIKQISKLYPLYDDDKTIFSPLNLILKLMTCQNPLICPNGNKILNKLFLKDIYNCFYKQSKLLDKDSNLD